MVDQAVRGGEFRESEIGRTGEGRGYFVELGEGR